MNWTENKVLLEYSPFTPCREIFQAVCDELGKHYVTKGFKYSRSQQKLTVETESIKLIIGFSSSRSNIPGEWICLEIGPAFFSKQLAKKNKNKGYIFGYPTIFYHSYTDNPQQIKVRQIFGDELERTEEDSEESKLIDNHTCNIYAINQKKFNQIIEFIDNKIIYWLNKISTKQGILELTTNASKTRKFYLKGVGLNNDFVEYVKTNFPNLDIEKILGD